MTMQDFRRMAAAIDQRACQLMAEGVTGRELIHRMVGHMPDLQRIWVGANDQQLAMLCQDYPGFYQYALVLVLYMRFVQWYSYQNMLTGPT
jgi:hypothetical protein